MATITQTKLVGFGYGNKANYSATTYANHIWFDPTNKQILLNGIEYIPKKLSELVNDSGFLTSITKSMVEGVLTGTISSHTHTFASITSKPTTLGGYGITDAMHFYEGQDYLAARFNDTSLAIKAANTYIELWQSGAGWFNLKAGKFITAGGTSSQFLKGDGSLDSNTYALASDLSKYLPLTGGTLSGSLTCNGDYINMNNDSGSRGYRGFFNQSGTSNRASGSHVFMGNGQALGSNAISLGYNAFAGIRNQDTDKGTYPYIAWQWMPTEKINITINNQDTANGEFYGYEVLGGKMVQYELGGNTYTYENTSTNVRVLVCVKDDADTGLIFGGKSYMPFNATKTLIQGKYILGSGESITNVNTITVGEVNYYVLAIYTWSATVGFDYSTQVKVMCATKVNNSNYNGASSYASGYYSVASGSYSVASGYYSVASGSYSVASGKSSVASGYFSVASGFSSVASGESSVASGKSSVASGSYSVASGSYSVASGYSSVASHDFSVVLARNGETQSSYQTIIGRYNAKVAGLFIIGNGSSSARSNAFVVDESGNVTARYFSGYANAMGNEQLKVYTSGYNEINFGGTSSSRQIFFGYRSMDSRPTPTTYNFGNGTATLKAASFTGNAATASKLGTSNVGSATQPIYLNGGTPTACSYTLAKSVPSNAVFTDTTYSVATASADGLMSAAMFKAQMVKSVGVQQGAEMMKPDGTITITNHRVYITQDKSNINGVYQQASGENDVTIPNATKDYDGSMSYTDKRKLDGISPYAPKKVVALRLSFNADATVTVISGGGDYDMTQDAEVMGSEYVEETSANGHYVITLSYDTSTSSNPLINWFNNYFVKFSFMSKSTDGSSDFFINLNSAFDGDTLYIQCISTKTKYTDTFDCIWELY